MKTLLIALAVSVVTLAGLSGSEARAAVRVRGYYRSNGTYVAPHYRSSPDRSFSNNWSTYPNVNPYTGRTGTKRYPSYSRSYRSYTPSYRSYTPRSYSSGFRSYGWRR